MSIGEQDKEEKSRLRKVGILHVPAKQNVCWGESKRRRVYQPAEGGPATGFLRSGNSPRLT